MTKTVKPEDEKFKPVFYYPKRLVEDAKAYWGGAVEVREIKAIEIVKKRKKK